MKSTSKASLTKANRKEKIKLHLFRSARNAARFNLLLKLLIAFLAALFALYPVAWIFSAALSPSNSLVNSRLIPSGASAVNFVRLWSDPLHPFLLWMWNSIKVSSLTALITVSLCALAAYSFSRFRYRGRRSGLLATLLIQLFPNTLAIVALFLLLQQIGKVPGFAWLGLNTLGGIILIYSGGALGFNTWLMKGFFDSIPKELDESALIDGASWMQAFVYVIFPLVRPILAVIGILTFIGTYSDFLVARVMLKSAENYTLAVGMTLFIRGQYTQEWGVFAAAALVGALPIVLIFLLLQRQLIGGLATGAVKG
ncbi:MAG: sugar ABC transporter permease [Anaerolineales bacterium]|nr:sugar ABC transporter permease [Anaerolineales bacterium]